MNHVEEIRAKIVPQVVGVEAGDPRNVGTVVTVNLPARLTKQYKSPPDNIQ